jgi:NADPH-dependent ferric siderophore reductase
MTIRPDFSLHAETTLPDLSFPAMRMVMLHEAQEHDLPVIEDTDERVTLETPFGHYSFGAVPGGVTAKVSAAKQDWLFMLKESLVEHLTHFAPDAAAALRWSDAEKAGSLPPNFHFATVQSVRPIGTCFLRVRIKARGLSSFQDDAIHFRIVLPPKGIDDVEWPSVSENGATVWPKGEKALHRPVYTTRWIDHAEGVMDFDVFQHEGGRVSEWASQVEPGTKVAVVGPGGGGIPDTTRILMFADETALPAAARILENLTENSKGHVTVRVEDGPQCAYSLSAPSGISTSWLSPESDQSLADLALAAHDEFPDHFLWFACEKADAQKVRAAFKAKGSDPANAYIAAYWSKP